jgi:hypothetical protein
LYEYKFLNHRVLIRALNKLGPEGLFDFFIPDVRASSAIHGDATVSAARTLFVERIRPLYGCALRTDDLYRSIMAICDDRAKQAMAPHDPDENVFRLLFVYLANHVWTMDNQPEEALRQVEADKFDCYALRRNHLVELRKDPMYVADDFVRRLAVENGFGPRLKELAYISFGRIALKECRRDVSWCRRQSGVMVNHIADWLAAAVATEAAWLSNVDNQGRPKKLMKFGSLAAMHAEADKHMRRRSAKESQRLTVHDEELFADGDGGFHLVQLKTSAALDRESAAMRHCVGHGAYDDLLKNEEYAMLSLRDVHGRQHATIEVYKGKVFQFRGKANSTPKSDYRDIAEKLLALKDVVFLQGDVAPRLVQPVPEAPAYLGAFRGMEGFMESFGVHAQNRFEPGGVQTR